MRHLRCFSLRDMDRSQLCNLSSAPDSSQDRSDNLHMYSMFVSTEVKGTRGGTFTVPIGRYLEYTSNPMALQLSTLSNDAIECLKSWPCILMNEGRSNELASIAKIVSLSSYGGGVRFTAEPTLDQLLLINDVLWKLRADLDIEQFEFGRNHFAVKDRDLFGVLDRAGYYVNPSVISAFVAKPLPSPTRSQLVTAIDHIAEWSHADIDRFLLECGVAGFDASRELGSRRDRATAIVQYAIKNPASITADNDLFSALLVSRALRNSVSHPPAAQAVPGPDTSKIEHTHAVSAVPNRVFVVHGRDDVARIELVSFLEAIGLEAIVLHDQPSMGRHLLTKFVDEAALVTFAVILMTDDDVGGVSQEELAPRARQNVILELGYFLSHLGQARVCAIKTSGLETPSDFDGIVYITMDDAQSWKKELLRELRAARMPVAER